MREYSSANIPFPPLNLTDDETEQLRATSEGFVQDHLRQYALLRQEQLQHGGFFNAKRWKVVSQKENVTVYKERNKFRQSSLGVANNPAIKVTKQRLQEYEASQSTMPVMVSIGTIPGTLEDIMFGLIMTTTTSMKVKTKYWEDHQIDGGILATMVKPTEQDPFHTANIKWLVKGVPAYVRNIVKARDLIYSEYTGIVASENGERIGYRMEHSLDFPETRDLYQERGIVRMKFSICSLFRELKNGKVEFFLKGVMDPLGNVMEKIAVDTAAEALVAYWRATYTAQMKKLAYFVRHAPASFPNKGPPKKTSNCEGCLKSFKFLARAHGCRLCGARVCSKCTVQRNLCFVLPNERVVMRKLSFCLTCLGKVNCADTRQIAIEELVHGDEFLLSPAQVESYRPSNFEPTRSTLSLSEIGPVSTTRSHTTSNPKGSFSHSSCSKSSSRASKASDDTSRSTSLLEDASLFHIPGTTSREEKDLVESVIAEDDEPPMFAIASMPCCSSLLRASDLSTSEITDIVDCEQQECEQRTPNQGQEQHAQRQHQQARQQEQQQEHIQQEDVEEMATMENERMSPQTIVRWQSHLSTIDNRIRNQRNDGPSHGNKDVTASLRKALYDCPEMQYIHTQRMKRHSVPAQPTHQEQLLYKQMADLYQAADHAKQLTMQSQSKMATSSSVGAVNCKP